MFAELLSQQRKRSIIVAASSVTYLETFPGYFFLPLPPHPPLPPSPSDFLTSLVTLTILQRDIFLVFIFINTSTDEYQQGNENGEQALSRLSDILIDGKEIRNRKGKGEERKANDREKESDAIQPRRDGIFGAGDFASRIAKSLRSRRRSQLN